MRVWDARYLAPLDVIHTVGPVSSVAIGADGTLYCAERAVCAFEMTGV